MHYKLSYRKAKKFKLNDDNEVNDVFSGSAKNPIKRDYDDYRGGGLWKEHANPVRRFFESSVGKPWDHVYATLCHRAKHNKPHVARFFREQADNQVRTNTIMHDGEVCYYDSWGGLKAVYGLYVHPETGLLMKVADAPRGQRYNWRNSPRTPLNGGFYIDNVEYFLHNITYQRRIACGVTEEVGDQVWMKAVPFIRTVTRDRWVGRCEKGWSIYEQYDVEVTDYKRVTVGKKELKQKNLRK